jgi:MtN3 and saliva related transmembrane protein
MVPYIGLLAGMLTTLSFVPQVLHVYRTRSVHDISLAMYITFCSGICLWVAYGICLGDKALILWNVVTLILSLSVLVMRIMWA